MRKIIVAAFVSIDGVMQAPGGPQEDPTGGFKFGGWTAPYFDESVGQEMGEMFERPFELLLGRKTYEIFAYHWPHAGADDPIAQVFNATTKYVATRSNMPLTWANSVRLESDVTEAVRKLKATDGPDLLTQGSSNFLQTLFAAGDLVDEIRTIMFPVVLGRGKRLFSDAARPMALSLTSARHSPSGVVISRYAPAGAVQTGDFTSFEPSPEELARRARMVAEA
jgi:dihydrofolate reductase